MTVDPRVSKQSSSFQTSAFQELSPRDTAIIFDRVTFAYTRGEEVFRDVSFRIPKGGFYFLTGPSGAGKSSLLKLIYKANPYYLGSIKVMGQEMKALGENALPAFRRKIGLMFQEFNLLEHLSTLDNVILPLTLGGENLEEAREKGAELLSWLGLGSFLYKAPSLLSGGQRQRIALARAVINDPDIILADEPTGHVDDKNAMKLMALFEILHKKGKTLVLSSHNRSLIDTMGFPEIALAQGTVTVRESAPFPSPFQTRPSQAPAYAAPSKETYHG